MVLGGGYHGQRLNKIYRGRANFVFLRPSILILHFPFLCRDRDRARNPSHSRANDQTLRSREA
jgi:hypothetical protein